MSVGSAAPATAYPETRGSKPRKSMTSAITIRGLRKSYDGREVLHGVDLEVQRGEVFCLLGPNGAGKTTTVEILEGYRTRTSGEVRVLGVDPAGQPLRLRQHVGIVLQECGMPRELTVAEVLDAYRSYFPAPRPLGELLDLVQLAEERDKRTKQLSGGQRRRLDLALALAGDPELVFLDEPTAGFDPVARRRCWGAIKKLAGLGKTIFLTTHFLEEAEELADRIAIMVDGRIQAEGDPAHLGERHRAPSVISFRLPQGCTADELPDLGEDRLLLEEGRVSVRTASPTAVLYRLSSWAWLRNLEFDALTVAAPTLEDVYLEFAGDGAPVDESR
jgi:ABC-2 type transport system ATP-binding protein